MNDQPNLPPPEEPGKNHKPEQETSLKTISLLVAFVPSLAALVLTTRHTNSPALGWGLLILAAVCCVGASIGLVRRMKSKVAQVLLAIFLSGFFFVANVIIAVLIGCSQMGPI
jgi:hypothetical protein